MAKNNTTNPTQDGGVSHKTLDFGLLKKLYTPTVRMMLHMNLASPDDVVYVEYLLKLSEETIIETKCCFGTAYLAYILDFRNKQLVYHNYNLFEFDPVEFDKHYAYTIDITGLSAFWRKNWKKIEKTFTDIGHEFVVIYHDDQWYIIDNYIDQRGLEQRRISVTYLKTFIDNIRHEFDTDSWNDMFNVKITDTFRTRYAYCYINRYEWSNVANEKFRYLTDASKKSLETRRGELQSKYY